MASPEKLNDDVLEKVAGGTLTKEEALEKALEDAGVDRDQVDFIKRTELDYEHGRKIYEVEFVKDGVEYEYDIDAETGRVMKRDRDYD